MLSVSLFPTGLGTHGVGAKLSAARQLTRLDVAKILQYHGGCWGISSPSRCNLSATSLTRKGLSRTRLDDIDGDHNQMRISVQRRIVRIN